MTSLNEVIQEVAKGYQPISLTSINIIPALLTVAGEATDKS